MGSGPNTEAWKTKGWKTVDIDESVNPDLVLNANLLEQNVPPASQDFVVAEYITFDPLAREGVGPGRLLQQANKALKRDGILVVQTASFEGYDEAKIPHRDKFSDLMNKHGFDAVVEVDTYYKHEGGKAEQRVVYYGRKKIEGYSDSRVGRKTSSFDDKTGRPIVDEDRRR